MRTRKPAVALNIGVGRPDPGRTFQNGGLVDLNHIPREHLGGCLPVSPVEARRLADARDSLGRFESLDEAAVYAELGRQAPLPHASVSRSVCNRRPA